MLNNLDYCIYWFHTVHSQYLFIGHILENVINLKVDLFVLVIIVYNICRFTYTVDSKIKWV